MTALLVLAVLTAVFAVVAIAVVRGKTPDTRDPDWALGRVIQPHS